MKRITFLLALLILLVVSVSIVTADNGSSDILSIEDSVVDSVAPDSDLDEISADAADLKDASKEKLSVKDSKEKLSDEDVILEGINVKKVWDDNGDAEGKRPSKVTFTVKLNGEDWYGPAELSEENGWQAYIEADLAADDQIDIVEEDVGGYTSEVSGSYEKGFTITNTLEDDDDNATDTDDDDDTSEDDSSEDTSGDSEPVTTTTTTTKIVKKQPEKAKDKHNTGNPVLLGVLAVSVAGLAYQLRRKE